MFIFHFILIFIILLQFCLLAAAIERWKKVELAFIAFVATAEEKGLSGEIKNPSAGAIAKAYSVYKQSMIHTAKTRKEWNL